MKYPFLIENLQVIEGKNVFFDCTIQIRKHCRRKSRHRNSVDFIYGRNIRVIFVEKPV